MGKIKYAEMIKNKSLEAFFEDDQKKEKAIKQNKGGSDGRNL